MIFKLDYVNDTALICAAYKGNLEIVRLLVEQEGIDINFKDVSIKMNLIIFKQDFIHCISFLY